MTGYSLSCGLQFWRLPVAALVLCVSVAFATAAPPPLRVVYFVTLDRQPLAKYEERLDRVMKEVQRFYRENMTATGYTNKTFALETKAL